MLVPKWLLYLVNMASRNLSKKPKKLKQRRCYLPQAETHHERSLRILEEKETRRKKELERRTALKRKEREREKEIEQRKKEKERKQQEKKIEYRIRINERNARTNTCSLLSLT